MSFEKLKPVQLLRLIRDRRANTWEGLCKESGVDPDRCESVESFLLNELDLLRKAGLIEFEIEEREPFTRPIEPTIN